MNIVELPTRKNFKNISFQHFGSLSVLSYAGMKKTTNAMWNCQCVCGEIKEYRSYALLSGHTKSCGCQRELLKIKKITKHGMAGSSDYRIYQSAKRRCMSLTDKAYSNYGGRGIQFKLNSFEEFIKAVGKKPTPKHTLERIDNSGNYELGNVTWATRIEQLNNTRRNVVIEIDGISKTIAQWANRDLRTQFRIRTRYKKLGWCARCSVMEDNCPHKIDKRYLKKNKS